MNEYEKKKTRTVASKEDHVAIDAFGGFPGNAEGLGCEQN